MIHVISTLSFCTKTLIRHFLSLSGICCHGSNFCARINCSLHLLAKKENSRCVMQCANPSPSGTQVIIIIFVSLFVIVFFSFLLFISPQLFFRWSATHRNRFKQSLAGIAEYSPHALNISSRIPAVV